MVRKSIKILSEDIFDFSKNSKNIKQQELVGDVIPDIHSEKYLNDLYKTVFSDISNQYTYDLEEKDFGILRNFTNNKSFENAFDLCHKLLLFNNNYEENTADPNKIENNAQIIIDCLDKMAGHRVPHAYKPGFLILIIRNFYIKKGELC